MIHTAQRRLSLLAILLLTAGCNSGSSPTPNAEAGTPQTGLPTTTMQIGKQTFTLEIATNHQQHETGLMYRDSMPADHGMIFIFAQERPLSFWMKHTRIPLDVMFVDAAGKVVSIHQMQPFDITGTTAHGPSKYAIELNQGACADAGVKDGDQLQFPPAITSATAEPSP